MNNFFNELITRDDNGWYFPTFDTRVMGHLYKEPDYPKQYSKFCKNNNCVIQAGGNIGWYPKMYSELFDLVYTFEPEFVNFNCLTLNLLNNFNIKKFQACLGESHQMTEVVVSQDLCGMHHVRTDSMEKSFVQNIPIFKIDDFCFNNCDLIQLDVEGHEIQALRGAKETIEKFKPIIIVEMAWSNPNSLLNSFGYGLIEKIGVDGIFEYKGI